MLKYIYRKYLFTSLIFYEISQSNRALLRLRHIVYSGPVQVSSSCYPSLLVVINAINFLFNAMYESYEGAVSV